MATWAEGVKEARAEYLDHPDDLGLAMMLFRIDPPDTAFQSGYLAGVRQLARRHCAALEAAIFPR